jgi:hypothetical protein
MCAARAISPAEPQQWKKVPTGIFKYKFVHVLTLRSLKFRNYHPKDEDLRKHMLPPTPDYIQTMQAKFDILTRNDGDEVSFF